MVSQGNPNFEPKNIFAAVSQQLGIVGKCPFLDGEFHGGECRVFKLSFEDEVSVAVRVRHANDDNSHDIMIAMVESEVRTFKTLEANGFQWAPRCLGISLTFDNPIQLPFVVLTWAEGLPLAWDEYSPPRPLRDYVLGQIASIQLSLIQYTLQDGSTTAMAFFGRRMGNKLKRVREGNLPELTEKDCLDQKALLDRVLGDDGNSTVFAIDHGDTKPGNIIVDENYNVTCVIDWGCFAALVPVIKAAGLPRFLWPMNSTGFSLSRTILKDRQAYTRYFSSLTSPAALTMLRWQTAEDVDFRTLYLESISSKGMHTSVARIGWKVDFVSLRNDEEQSHADTQ